MKNRSVAVIGLGYVGLPLAVLAKEKGWEVTGIDIDEEKVRSINKLEVPFEDAQLAKDLKEHPINATTEFSAVATAAILVVAVPTPVTDNNQPDLTPLTSAITSLHPHLQEGQVLIVESTINPGVMDEVVQPLVKDAPAIHLAHCPERINPGDSQWSVRNIPRVLGGYTQEGTMKAQEFYASVLDADVKVMGSATEAEAVKILENTFRDINIAYINEMARSFAVLGINITNVIEGAATKPFAFMPHYPGNGVGGHCISVDPYYMIERAKQVGFDHEFLKLARQINEDMPAYTVELLEKALHKNHLTIKDAKLALLGIAYKKGVSDTRNSPALKTLDILEGHGADVRLFDPHVPEKSTVTSLAAALNGADAVLLTCDHDELVSGLTPQALQNAGIKAVIDGKNALDMDGIAAAQIPYFGIGRKKLLPG